MLWAQTEHEPQFVAEILHVVEHTYFNGASSSRSLARNGVDDFGVHQKRLQVFLQVFGPFPV